MRGKPKWQKNPSDSTVCLKQSMPELISNRRNMSCTLLMNYVTKIYDIINANSLLLLFFLILSSHQHTLNLKNNIFLILQSSWSFDFLAEAASSTYQSTLNLITKYSFDQWSVAMQSSMSSDFLKQQTSSAILATWNTMTPSSKTSGSILTLLEQWKTLTRTYEAILASGILDTTLSSKTTGSILAL